MSLENLFYYRRLKDGKPVEEIWDCFSVFRVVRGWWSSPEVFSVMLDDGHEEARDAERTFTRNGKPKTEQIRERGWYLTQIDMCRQDGERLKKATELYPLGKWYLDRMITEPMQPYPSVDPNS